MSGPPAGSERHGNWFTRGGWWFIVNLLSAGLLLPVPLASAAVRTRRPWHVVAAVASLVLVVATFVLVGAADRGPDGSTTGLFATLSSMSILTLYVGGLAALIVVRHQVFGPRARPTGWDRPLPDPAVAAALAARGRREEARRRRRSAAGPGARCAARGPAGGPARRDGGLVDLNAAPPQAIARTCGIAPEHAERIVACRSAAGRFAAVEDVFVWADLPYEIWDHVRDRAVVLGR